MWSSFLRELSRGWPMAQFPAPPAGIVNTTIDAWSGGAPGPWTRDTKTEYFIDGTQPGSADPVDQSGLLYRQTCGRWFVDITKAEQSEPQRWLDADIDWMDRARRGVGIRGPERRPHRAHVWARRLGRLHRAGRLHVASDHRLRRRERRQRRPLARANR